LISTALHNQDTASIRQTLEKVGVRLNQIDPDIIVETLQELPSYVREHDLPYSILHDTEISEERAREILEKTKLN